MMEFHISREARDRYQVSDALFNFVGNVIFGDLAACRELAYRMSQSRDKNNSVPPGALFAMGLIDEVSHALVAQYRRSRDPEVSGAALRWFAGRVGEGNVERLLRGFVEEFPSVAVYRGEVKLDEWLNGSTEGLTHREAVLEEMILLWLANRNPAFGPFKELYDDRKLAQSTSYKEVTAELRNYFAAATSSICSTPPLKPRPTRSAASSPGFVKTGLPTLAPALPKSCSPPTCSRKKKSLSGCASIRPQLIAITIRSKWVKASTMSPSIRAKAATPAMSNTSASAQIRTGCRMSL
jgi:hypothetical protein